MPAKTLLIALVATSALAAIGCTNSPANNADTNQSVTKVDTHDSWWCDEHGVPEEICAQCNPKLAAKFKADGDWCKLHDRPDSQCFICHPELEAKFAEKYEAKYNKKPPKPES